MSRVTLGATLVAVWMLLWGDAGFGPLVGGGLMVVALFVVFPSDRAVRPRVVPRPIALVALAASFGGRLVVSNATLSRELLRRRSTIRSVIVEIPMRTSSPALLTSIVNLAALTPGTVVVDVDASDPMLVVHVLLFDEDDTAPAVSSIRRLEELTVRAFGSAAQIAELDRPAGPERRRSQPTGGDSRDDGVVR